MKRQVLLSLIIVLVSYKVGAQNIKAAAGNTNKSTTSSRAAKPVLSIRIFSNDTLKNNGDIKGFGYDIYRNGTLFIHQPTVPALAGNKGFSSVAGAQKTGSLVMYKIRKGLLPPSVSKQEVDSLGVGAITK